ncbi:hypothetical protein BUALT_Bualt19G0001200 [Buddleja alternifolia]|uniref:Protein yippee-like n=1 Tax=Buddleja alternifolia TaxID=168488 RepID=A0AAV6W4C1_9LAMI|nr:hypothetical protein BUALT_Bualt19G0001200 [Buddleja alternifolia]
MSSIDDLIGSRFYCCFRCRNILAAHDDIVSKSFEGPGAGGRRAFLFSHTMNVLEGESEDRQLITGMHMVADVFCGDCGELLGWKYEKAYHTQNMYKQGKTVLIKSKIAKPIDSTFY